MDKSANPPVLLFVPSLMKRDGHNAPQIARVIASSQSRLHPGTYSVKVDSRLDGPENVASILDPNGRVVLRVIDVDYRARLAETSYARASKGWSLLSSGRFALLGILRLLTATGSSKRRSKTGRHRWFLLMGFAAVLLLISAFGFLALAALAALGVDRISWLEPSADSNQLAWGAGLGSAAGALWWIRARVVEGGQRMGGLVRYLENDRAAASVALALDVEIDRLLDSRSPPGAIHILAYRFGSIVALDALFPRVPRREDGNDRLANAVKSLVTVGCPVDFVRQFYPRYFEARNPRKRDIKWTNLFLPEDILGSNFLNNDDNDGFIVHQHQVGLPTAAHVVQLQSSGENKPSAGPTTTPTVERHRSVPSAAPGDESKLIKYEDVFDIAGVRPTRSIPVGCEGLTLKSLLNFERVLNGEYWDQADSANLLEPVIDSWFGTRATSGSGAPVSQLSMNGLASGSAPHTVESKPETRVPPPPAVGGNPPETRCGAETRSTVGCISAEDPDDPDRSQFLTAGYALGAAERALGGGADRPADGGEDRPAEREAA